MPIILGVLGWIVVIYIVLRLFFHVDLLEWFSLLASKGRVRKEDVHDGVMIVRNFLEEWDRQLSAGKVSGNFDFSHVKTAIEHRHALGYLTKSEERDFSKCVELLIQLNSGAIVINPLSEEVASLRGKLSYYIKKFDEFLLY